MIQASNVRFDESLMEGKRVIDEHTKDTLQDLPNAEPAEDSEPEDDQYMDTIAEHTARPSGLVMEAENDSSLATRSLLQCNDPLFSRQYLQQVTT